MYLISACVVLIIILILLKVYAVVTLGKCSSKRKLHGKTALVTGSSRGIGYYTALDLARRGARVIITSENKEAVVAAKDKIIKETGNTNIVAKYLDYLSFDVVRSFAKDILDKEERLDILINNAGTLGLGKTFTKDGLQPGMQVNYLGPFLLTNLLLGLLKKSAPSRVVNVASVVSQIPFGFKLNDINKCGYDNLFYEELAYSNSKRCVVHTTMEMADKLQDSGVTVNCLHPGAVYTILHNLSKLTYIIFVTECIGPLYYKTPEQGAQTSIHLAVSESVEGVTGKYFSDCRVSNWWGVTDKKIQKKVWDQSVKLVKLSPEEMHFD